MEREKERERADKQITKDKLFAVGAGIICALLLVTIGYVLMFYSESYFIVAVLAVMLVISLFVMINSTMSIGRRTKEQDKEDYDEIAKAQKAQYLIIKKNFEELTSRMARLEKEGAGSSIPAEEIIEAQKAVAKITISRSKENADALMNSNDVLFEKVDAFEGKLKESSADILSEQKKLLDETKAEIANQNRNLENRLSEMQRTLAAIEQNQRMIGNQPPVMMVAQAMPATGTPMMQQPYMAPVAEAAAATPVPEPTPMPEPEPIPEPEPMPMEEPVAEPEIAVEPEIPEMPEMSAEPEIPDIPDIPAEAEMSIEPEMEIAEEMSELDIDIPEMPELPADDIPVPETSEDLPMPDLDELMSMDLTTEEIPDMTMPDLEEPEPEPVPEPVPEPEPIPEPKPAPEPEPAPEPAAAPVVEPVSDDPNAQLSPDQIAAMFAQVDSPVQAAEPEPAPAPEPPTVEPVSDDPNAQLTPEQIAAMFAQVQ